MNTDHDSKKPSFLSVIRPKVILRRVEDKPQRYAAHSIPGDTLLGYCGRDGVIVNPVGEVTAGMRTEIISFEDPRMKKKGLQRTVGVVDKLLAKKPANAPKSQPEWREAQRKFLGLYVSGHVSGPGWGNPGYFQAVYEVVEGRINDDGPREFRTRIDHGGACRMYGEGYDAFISLYKSYVFHAKQHDDGHHQEAASGDCFVTGDGSPAEAVAKAAAPPPATKKPVKPAKRPARPAVTPRKSKKVSK